MDRLFGLHVPALAWHVLPQDLPQKRWLDYHVQYFPSVELNNTHYMTPSEKTFEGWRDNSPEGFLFAIKANRYITHMKKLKDPEEPLQRQFERARLLGPKLGPVLYQLPPRWGFDAERLETFLQALPKDFDDELYHLFCIIPGYRECGHEIGKFS